MIFVNLEKKKIIFLVKILVSTFLIVIIFFKIDWLILFSYLKEVKASYFIIVLFLYFVALFFTTFKWKSLLGMLDFPINYLVLLRLNFVSLFYALFLPGGFLAGEAVKTLKFVRSKNDKGLLFSSILLDKYISAFSFVILGTICYSISTFNSYFIFSSYLTLSFLLLIVFLFLSNSRFCNLVLNILNSLLLNKRIADFLVRFKEKLVFTKLIPGILWGMFFQFALSLALFVVLLSLGVEIKVVDVVWINSLLSLVTMLPVSFLGLGVRDISLIYLLSFFNVSGEIALVASMLVLSAVIIRGLFGGLLEFLEIFNFSKN